MKRQAKSLQQNIKPDYYFQTWPDGETCERCGAAIHSGWVVNGKKYGPTCGKRILKASGITWPAKYGPGSFDPGAMRQAVEAQAWSNGQWALSYDERTAIKATVGLAGWSIAQAIAAGSTLRLTTPDAVRCYEAATK